jgi:LytR cell envelope-related transcriptional attenuator
VTQGAGPRANAGPAERVGERDAAGSPPPLRPPVRARSGRRPLPPLIFLLVLAVLASGTWWYVLRDENARERTQAAACSSAAAAPPSLAPSSVTLRVFNATSHKGLAGTVAKQLQSRGFKVTEIANDPSGRKVTGVGEVRHGPRGNDAAAYVAAYLTGASDYQDTRASSTVDVVLGPEFKQLATSDQVATAVRSGAAANASC